MRVLVLGRSGQLAGALARQAARHPSLDLVFAGRPELDLERSESLAPLLGGARPDLVVNAAAFTAVDAAETDGERAFLVNAAAVGALARAARGAGCALLHVSTDYVFDGEAGRPYGEADAPRPLNVYGRSKLAGEEALRDEGARHMIVRTAWVYGPSGRNFVRRMLELSAARPEIRVVADQLGSPTAAPDLAEGLLAAVEGWARRGLGGAHLYHLAGQEPASWWDVAEEAVRLAAAADNRSCRVAPISAAEWPAAAARPRDSRLNSDRFARDFGFRCRSWRQALPPVVAALLAEERHRERTA